MKSRNRYVLWGLVLVMITLAACSTPRVGGDQTPVAGGEQPEVMITNPSNGETIASGQELKIQSTSVDGVSGIVRVELWADNQMVWVDANPNPQPNTPYIVAQAWTPQVPGSHVVEVRAYNVDNVAGKSETVVVEVAASAQAVADGTTPTLEPVTTNTPVTLDTPAPLVDSAPEATATFSTPADPEMPTPTPTITATPTATPTPGSFTSTGLQPEGRFKDIWLEVGGGKSRLGYPTGPEVVDRDYARQYFENGLMFWWDNPVEDDGDIIWVVDAAAADLKSGTASNRYTDIWDGGDEFSCNAARANGNFGPVRGFGKLWCERAELQIRLGNPRDYEGGSGGNPPFAQVQFFQGGVMIYNPLNAEVYVLFDQGDWQRFKY